MASLFSLEQLVQFARYWTEHLRAVQYPVVISYPPIPMEPLASPPKPERKRQREEEPEEKETKRPRYHYHCRLCSGNHHKLDCPDLCRRYSCLYKFETRRLEAHSERDCPFHSYYCTICHKKGHTTDYCYYRCVKCPREAKHHDTSACPRRTD